MNEFFAMGGYASYVWSCYGLTLAVLIGNLWFARRALRAQELRATRRATQLDTPTGGAVDAL
jgi:heme exporter protein D